MSFLYLKDDKFNPLGNEHFMSNVFNRLADAYTYFLVNLNFHEK